jgi:hypothetical protein
MQRKVLEVCRERYEKYAEKGIRSMQRKELEVYKDCQTAINQWSAIDQLSAIISYRSIISYHQLSINY